MALIINNYHVQLDGVLLTEATGGGVQFDKDILYTQKALCMFGWLPKQPIHCARISRYLEQNHK